MFRRPKILFFIIIVIIVVFIAWFIVSSQSSTTNQVYSLIDPPANPSSAVVSGTIFSTTSTTAQISQNSLLSNVMPAILVTDLNKSYIDSTYGFSFKYPSGYNVSSTNNPATGGKIIIIQNSSATWAPGSASSSGLQISMQKIDENLTDLTVLRIHQDLPDLMIGNPQSVTIDSVGHGTAFISNDKLFDGSSREVWFVNNKVLYQLVTYAADDSLAESVLRTWKW